MFCVDRQKQGEVMPLFSAGFGINKEGSPNWLTPRTEDQLNNEEENFKPSFKVTFFLLTQISVSLNYSMRYSLLVVKK